MNKRILSLVLALVMVLGTFGTVFAAKFDDVAGTEFESAVKRLDLLGILEGYPDGTFQPNGNITRAEFAAVAVRAKGMESVAAAAKGLATGFNDVPATHWASGYVGTAGKLGIVNGVGYGQFDPSAPVRYEEAVTMIVRALGYEPAAKAKGGYPYGYLIVANEVGLLDEVKGTQGLSATRGMVAQLTDNALEIPMMVQVGFGGSTNDEDKWVISGSKEHGGEEFYLLDEMGFDTYEGRVTKVNTKKDEITLDNEDKDLKLKDVTLEVADGFDYYAVEGVTIKAWYNDDALIIYTVKDEVKFDAVAYDKKEEVTLIEEDANYDVSDDAVLLLDGEEVELEDFEADYAKIVLNDDNDVIWLEGYTLDNFLVFEEADKDIIVAYGEELDVEDFTIVKDGVTISIDDLVEGDIVFYNSTEEFANVYNNTVEGEITKIYTNKITVDGSDYKFDNKNDDAKYINEDDEITNFTTGNFEDVVEAMQDKGDVVVFLNRHGEMVFLKGDLGDLITSSAYVMVTKTTASFNNRGTAMWTFDVINAAGEEVKYDIKATDVDATGVSKLKAANGADAVWSTTNIVAETVVEIEIDKDGKVKEVQLLGTETVGPNANIKTSARYYDGKKIDSDAPIFSVEDFTTDVKDIVVNKYSELDFDFIEEGTFFVDGTKVVSIVISDSDREDDSETYLTVATADQDKVSGKNIWRLKLVIDGAKATYETKEDIATPSVTKGDFLEVKIDNKTGKVNSVSETFTNQVVSAGSVSAINTSAKSLVIGSETFKLGSDNVIVDATDSYKVISLSNLKTGDTAKALRVSNGSAYVEVIVRTAKAGTTPAPTGTTGLVTYINDAVGSESFSVDNKTPYFLNTKTVLTDKDGVVLEMGAQAVLKGTNKLVEDDQVEVSISGDVMTIKILATKAQLAAAAEQKIVNTELAKVTASYSVPFGTAAGTDTETAVKNLVDVQVDTAKVTVSVARVGTTNNYKVTLTGATVTTVKGEKEVAVTVEVASADASLSGIKLDGFALAGFASGTVNYNVELANGTTAEPVVSATKTNTNANIAIAQATDVEATDNVANVATITVTAQDGTIVVYKITFTVAA